MSFMLLCVIVENNGMKPAYIASVKGMQIKLKVTSGTLPMLNV